APAPRAPSRPATPAAPMARTPSPPDEEEGPVITLSAPPGVTARQADPAAPKPGPSTMARRIWAKKGGASERPFDDSGVFNAVSPTVPTRQQSGELPRKPANVTGPAEIVDLPPNATPPPIVSPWRRPPPGRPAAPPADGPVVVPGPPGVRPTPQRPGAEPQATPQPRQPRTSTMTPRVQIAAPSADGVVIARPPSVVVSGSVNSGSQ